MEKIPLVILAGYSPKPKLLSKLAIGISYVFNHERYLWDLEKSLMTLRDKEGNERSLLEIMLGNVSDSKNIDETVYVVGTEKVKTVVERYNNHSEQKIDFRFVPQGFSLGENMQLAYKAVQEDKQSAVNSPYSGYVLFLTSDLPLVHGKDIDEMLKDVDFSVDTPLILSYIKSATLTNFKRHFFHFFDGKSKFNAKESNLEFGNNEADFVKLNRLYNIRKMLNPNNWVKAVQTYAETSSGLKGIYSIAKKIVSDFVTKKAVDFSMVASIFEHLVEQKVSFYEVKNPVFSMDVDSQQDLEELGYKRK